MALDIDKQLDSLLSDPLEELWMLHEADLASRVLEKPDLQDGIESSYEGPNKGDFDHPVSKEKKMIDALVAQGINPIQAHKQVHGEVDSKSVESKGKLAATLGRIQDDNLKKGVRMEPEKGSILSRDAALEKQLDQVTPDDLRTPMNQQVPDRDQTAADQEVSMGEEYDYNEDVAYLQKFGRA